MRCANCLPGADECVGIPERVKAAAVRALLCERFRLLVACGRCGDSCVLGVGALRMWVRSFPVDRACRLGWSGWAERRVWHLALKRLGYVVEAAVFAARGASV